MEDIQWASSILLKQTNKNLPVRYKSFFLWTKPTSWRNGTDSNSTVNKVTANFQPSASAGHTVCLYPSVLPFASLLPQSQPLAKDVSQPISLLIHHSPAQKLLSLQYNTKGWVLIPLLFSVLSLQCIYEPKEHKVHWGKHLAWLFSFVAAVLSCAVKEYKNKKSTVTFGGFYLHQEQCWLISWPSIDLIHHAEPTTMTKRHLILQQKYSEVQLEWSHLSLN